MSKKNVEPRFLPCVATHYRNVVKTQLAKVADIKECITEKYNGHLEPELLAELDALSEQTKRVFDILNAKSSKPIELS